MLSSTSLLGPLLHDYANAWSRDFAGRHNCAQFLVGATYIFIQGSSDSGHVVGVLLVCPVLRCTDVHFIAKLVTFMLGDNACNA